PRAALCRRGEGWPRSGHPRRLQRSRRRRGGPNSRRTGEPGPPPALALDARAARGRRGSGARAGVAREARAERRVRRLDRRERRQVASQSLLNRPFWILGLALAGLLVEGRARADNVDDDDLRRPQRLTVGVADDLLGQLSVDGKTLYFVSNRDTSNQIFAQS